MKERETQTQREPGECLQKIEIQYISKLQSWEWEEKVTNINAPSTSVQLKPLQTHLSNLPQTDQ